jgi:hypothetical protein
MHVGHRAGDTRLELSRVRRRGVWRVAVLSAHGLDHGDPYGPAQYIVLDLIGNVYPIFDPTEYQQRVTELKESNDYSILFEQDNYLLLRKN